MAAYVLSVDQSTQGTKSLLFGSNGELLARADLPHRQMVSDMGWVSHDPNEIYENVLKTVEMVCQKASIQPDDIVCMGMSNQRETSIAWDRQSGKPVCDAIVWQCARAAALCAGIEKSGMGETIRSRTGIPVSPYFPAAKLAWMLQHIPEAAALNRQHQLCMGTVESYLVFRLTGQYRTDYSNASRTQLFNIRTLAWDDEICRVFGIDPDDLPTVTASDGVFGETDLNGLLRHKIPICGVLGDSHGALFGQGCLHRGMTKATYGTGASVMMNIGSHFIPSQSGLVTSLAWKHKGRIAYVLEGNLNYAGAVITWLKDHLGIIASAEETETLARSAHPADTTCLVPAFTGLGTPYWMNEAKALICGMTRLTGRAELARAALDCIAHQIHDIVCAMEKDTGIRVPALRVDGGPTGNSYLMQFQSDMLGVPVVRSDMPELSGTGAAYMAGMAFGCYAEDVFENLHSLSFTPQMTSALREEKLDAWRHAVQLTQGYHA